jgi:hypothetical protein
MGWRVPCYLVGWKLTRRERESRALT